MKCRNGHESVTCLQEQKFEVLFELAVNAILDSYYREAVTSFTSALERFYEFYIRVISAKRGLRDDYFCEAWGKIAAQSERQLGAYIFVYTLEKQIPPPFLSNRILKFRNDVIHDSKIPKKDEAIEYGKAIFDVIVPVLSDLKLYDYDHVQTVVSRHVTKTRQQIQGTPDILFMSIPTTISISRAASEPQQNLEEALLQLSQRRARIGW